jgi:hypothetical protein
MTVELFAAPSFFMEVKASTSTSWTQCQDFTEGHQASSTLKHVLTGDLKFLSNELITLMSSDANLARICQVNDPSTAISSPSAPNLFGRNFSLDEGSRRESNPMYHRGSTVFMDSPISSPLQTTMTNVLSLDMSPTPNFQSLFSPAISSPFMKLNSEFTMTGNSPSSFGSPLLSGYSEAGPLSSIIYENDFLMSISDFLS